METQDKIKREVKRKIDDIRSKFFEAHEQLEREENPSLELKNLIKELEDIQKKLDEKYEGIKTQTDVNWSEIDKAIFKDINAFNSAFEKAGTLFSGK